MKTFTTLALGACMTVALAGGAFAQTSSMSGMTSSEKATMTKCQGMSKSAMQADSQCSALMKKYPSATTGSGTGMSGGMNGSSTTSPTGSGTSPGSSSK
jgi:pentapeptide MXKDX repeat protein